eukprot:TRINITY_DN62008_c0_g1_i1.p1 TRINITY_DN62008_c0_g1~~TRINITY_DN62008_c0_g1_i1.p1  ORF type:complete len:404 (+),score=81.81 TRINITY_DN62008_c0_g1_i1:52-1212(+)
MADVDTVPPEDTISDVPNSSDAGEDHRHSIATQVRLERHNEIVESSTGMTPFMGKVGRQSYTGDCQLHNMGKDHDFVVVDLLTRPCLFGHVKEFIDDPYIFKPVPLSYRTWIYHSHYRSGRNIQSPLQSGDDVLLRDALVEWCIDARVNAGQWSPTLIYILLGFVATISGDRFYTAVALLECVFLYLAASMMNEPDWYRFERIVTMPSRLAFFIYTIIRMFMAQTGLVAIGTALCALLMILDAIFGDGMMLVNYKLTCKYEIVRELPNRLFVCQRIGAAGQKGGEDVPTIISGMMRWENHWVLIADIKGLLVELQPMTAADWSKLTKEYALKAQPQLFFGLDVYDDHMPTALHLIKQLTKSCPSEAEMLALVAQSERPSAETDGVR